MRKLPFILIAILIIALGLVWFVSSVYASDTGAVSPGTMADDATIGTVSWINPNNAKVSDNIYTTATNGAQVNATTHYLKATNFGFSVPTGATINGITAEFERKRESFTTATDNEIKIVKSDGSIGTTNKSTGATWSGTEAYVSFGGVADLWGETWTSSDINDADFGVVISAIDKASPDSGQIEVDHIRITVTYTVADTQQHVSMTIGNSNVVVGNSNILIP